LVSGLVLVLSLAVPAALGIRDLMGLLIAALILVFPAFVLGFILVFKIIPAKYAFKNEVLTLFQKSP
jgi:hypothetical protein